MAELTGNEQQLNTAIEELHTNEQQIRARITEAEERSRAAEHAHLTAKIEAELRAEHEDQRIAEFASLRSDLDTAAERRAEKIQTLNAGIDKLRVSDQEQHSVIASVEAALHTQQEAKISAQKR